MSAITTTYCRSTRTQKPTNNVILDTIGPLVLPIAAAVYFLRRHLKKRKAAAAARGQQKAKKDETKSQEVASRSKPRREYKVKRDRQEAVAEIAEARQQQLQQQQREIAALGHGDHVMQAYNEDEVDALQQASEGDQQNQFFSMLKSMGFKVVAPKDGSNQVLLVPPGQEEGAEGQEGGGGAILEGDEEGYEDEDEDEDEEEDEDEA